MSIVVLTSEFKQFYAFMSTKIVRTPRPLQEGSVRSGAAPAFPEPRTAQISTRALVAPSLWGTWSRRTWSVDDGPTRLPADGLEEHGWIGVVAERLAHVDVAVHVARSQDETRS